LPGGGTDTTIAYNCFGAMRQTEISRSRGYFPWTRVHVSNWDGSAEAGDGARSVSIYAPDDSLIVPVA